MESGNIVGKWSRLHIPISRASLAVLSVPREPIWYIILLDGMSIWQIDADANGTYATQDVSMRRYMIALDAF